MREKKALLFSIILIITLGFAGCYMETPQSEGTVSLNIQSRDGSIGDFGDGTYIIARVYDAEFLESLMSDSDPGVAASGGIYYQPFSEISYLSLPAPSMVTVEFAGSDYPYEGSFSMPVFISSKKYRLLVEYHELSEGGTSDYMPYAGISDPFEVAAGADASVSIDLVNYFYEIMS